MSKSFAVVGSGPSGFYAAEALARKFADAEIDLIERLPMPYGLARFGVAPDHQGTKNITRVFARLPEKPNVRFLGLVELGRDVSLSDLLGLYDAVVLATGAPEDRHLGIPGGDLPGVVGSGTFVSWYNAHPDFAAAGPDLSRVQSVAIIGNGNVAIDVARVLARTPVEMAKSDLSPAILAAIAAAPLSEIHIIGRRGPVEASFTNAELAELGHLARCQPQVRSADLPASAEGAAPEALKIKEANLATLRSFAGQTGEKPIRLHFHFHARPVALLGNDHLAGLRIMTPEGEQEIRCQLAVTCIGYRARPLAGVPYDEASGTIANDGGRVATGLYAVGWAACGPSGVIATNRQNAIAVVDLIAADAAASGSPKAGRAGLDAALARKGVRPVLWDDWKKIDAAEVAAAKTAGLTEAPRLKMRGIAEALAAIGRN